MSRYAPLLAALQILALSSVASATRVTISQGNFSVTVEESFLSGTGVGSTANILGDRWQNPRTFITPVGGGRNVTQLVTPLSVNPSGDGASVTHSTWDVVFTTVTQIVPVPSDLNLLLPYDLNHAVRQSISFSNPSDIPYVLQAFTRLFSSVGGDIEDDTVMFDPIARALVLEDRLERQLVAVFGDESNATLGWDISSDWVGAPRLSFPFPMANPTDSMSAFGEFAATGSVGLDAGILGPGESVTLDFLYVSSADSTFPSQSPEPTGMTVLAVVLALGSLATRRRRARVQP